MNKLLYFKAPWCAPCKILAPALDTILKDLPNYELELVDVEANPQMAQLFRVRSVPTLIVLGEQDKVKDTLIGFSNIDATKQFLVKNYD
jgi:thioredoxin 1